MYTLIQSNVMHMPLVSPVFLLHRTTVVQLSTMIHCKQRYQSYQLYCTLQDSVVTVIASREEGNETERGRDGSKKRPGGWDKEE